MTRHLQLAIIGITALTWAGFVGFFGFPESWTAAIKPFSAAITVSALAVLAHEHLIWKCGIFGFRLVKVADYSGVWKVRFQSSYKDEETGLQIGPLFGFAQIDQTATTFCMRLFTEEARSESFAYSIKLENNVFQLSIVYRNTPSIVVRAEESRMHNGSAIFESRGFKPTLLEGEYWTERMTTGEMRLYEKKKGGIVSYEQGLKLFNMSATDFLNITN